MATAAASRLTVAHRRGQLRIAAQTIATMRAVWPLLDADDLDASYERWFPAALSVVEAQHGASSRLAASYVSAFKAAEVGRAARAVMAPSVSIDTVATSLTVTGPVSVKQAIRRGVPLVRAMTVAEASSAASAMRHALNGGRDTVRATLAADRDARGYARVTSGDSCDFCNMLAGRGAVYSADTGDFEAHDGCSCMAEPVYR